MIFRMGQTNLEWTEIQNDGLWHSKDHTQNPNGLVHGPTPCIRPTKVELRRQDNVPGPHTNFTMYRSWPWRLQMGLGKIRLLANTLVLNPVRFQVQILRILAWVDLGRGSIGWDISGVGWTLMACENPNSRTTNYPLAAKVEYDSTGTY